MKGPHEWRTVASGLRVREVCAKCGAIFGEGPSVAEHCPAGGDLAYWAGPKGAAARRVALQMAREKLDNGGGD